MDKLEDRFDKEIEASNFNLLEISGFMKQPKLAIKAGMAIGYKMAIDDITSHQNAGVCPECGCIHLPGGNTLCAR